jgi:hypothetical protein
VSVIKLKSTRVRVRLRPLLDGALYCRAEVVAMNGRVLATTKLVAKADSAYAITSAHALASERGWTVVDSAVAS